MAENTINGRRYSGLSVFKNIAGYFRSKANKFLNKNIGREVKVSVVVPIYNVKPYLRQCLDSILSQTLKEIEIICVNDGSTDGSKDVISEYAKKDRRIVVINKANSGYGASMNRGIARATGEYVAIVEPDDFIDQHMFDELYQAAVTRGRVDIIKSSYWQYFDDDGNGEKILNAPILAVCHPPKEVFDVWTYPEIIYHHPAIWSCLYRRAFLLENKVRFVEAQGAGWVDNPFLLETFCLARAITWMPKPYYYYRQTNPNSSSFVKDCSMPFQRTQEMLDFAAKNNITNAEVLGSIYDRILFNAGSALVNPNYDPAKDKAIIVSQLRMIDPAFMATPRVREAERKAYDYFLENAE